nr:hypothetical protein [Propionicimonas sp.]
MTTDVMPRQAEHSGLGSLTPMQLEQVQLRYASDTAFAQALIRDPVRVLHDEGLDGGIPCVCDAHSLGELLTKVPESAVSPTLASLGLIIQSKSDYEIVNKKTANVKAVVNAAVVANAAVYHEAAAATIAGVVAVVVAVAGLTFTGTPSPHKGERLQAPALRFADGFDGAGVLDHLSASGLGEARQLALLRRAAIDGDLISSALTENGFEARTTRYDVDGTLIDVDSLIGINEVVIQGCAIAREAALV